MEIKGQVGEVQIKVDGAKIVVDVDSLMDGIDFSMLVGMRVILKDDGEEK